MQMLSSTGGTVLPTLADCSLGSAPVGMERWRSRLETTKGVRVPTETVEEAAELPLEGVRVVELAGGIAAAFAARELAGFGADVVRVEGAADGPPLTADEETYLAAGKRRVDAGGVD